MADQTDATLVVGNELVVRDGTGAMVVPSSQLVLTHASALLRLPALTDAVAALTTITVETQPQAKRVLDDVRAARKAAEQHHDAQKRPINDVRAYALQLEKDDVSSFKALETTLGARLLAFDAEVERQRKVEQARRNAEALAQAQAEADARAKALRDAAKAEEDAAVKRQLNAQARALKSAPVIVAPVVVEPVVQKVSTTKRYRAEITNVEQLIVAVAVGIIQRQFPHTSALWKATCEEASAPVAALEVERLIESHPWLNAQATQDREEFGMPGVVVVETTSLTGR